MISQQKKNIKGFESDSECAAKAKAETKKRDDDNPHLDMDYASCKNDQSGTRTHASFDTSTFCIIVADDTLLKLAP